MSIKKPLVNPPELMKQSDTTLCVINPVELQSKIKVVSPPGEFSQIIHVDNNLSSPIVVINEFQVESVVSSKMDRNLARVLTIRYQLPKNISKTVVGGAEAHRVVITEEELRDNGGSCYIDEVNLVIAFQTKSLTCQLVHPFGKPSYSQLMSRLAEEVGRQLETDGIMFVVNEPEYTNRNYFLFLLGSIFSVKKISYPGETVLTLFVPGTAKSQRQYFTDTYAVGTDVLGVKEVKEFVLRTGIQNTSFWVCDDIKTLQDFAHKKRLELPNTVSKFDHEELEKALIETHKAEVEKLTKENEEKLQKVSDELAEKLATEIKKNENLQVSVDSAKAMSKVFSEYTAQTHAVNTASHKETIASLGAKESEVAFFANTMKYGLTVLGTVASVLVAKKIFSG